MSPGEQVLFAGLPARVEMFRGFSDRGAEDGISWALQRDFAEAFAHRWAVMRQVRGVDGLFLARSVVGRESIVACFDREAIDGTEVIIPTPVLGSEVTTLDPPA
jgi:hypothetical protein